MRRLLRGLMFVLVLFASGMSFVWWAERQSDMHNREQRAKQNLIQQTSRLAEGLGGASIPDASLGARRKGLPNAYGKDYKFSTDWFTPSIPVWRRALAAYVGKPDLQYLEIGVFEGRSLIWVAENILTNPSSHFTVIDPFLDQFEDKNSSSEEYDKDWFAKKNVEITYYDNIKLCGIEDRVTTMKGFSQTEMEKLPIAAYDIIYIDGSHKTRNVLEDAILAMRRLKVGGILIFDDYVWGGDKFSSPFPAINIFYALYEDELDVVHKGYQIMFTKKER